MYNKIDYWGERKDPNSDKSKTSATLQVEWTKNFLDMHDNILDYGPGVLRMLDLYKNINEINFYDISSQYKSIVEKKCADNGILIKKYVIDNSGVIKTPFKTNEFDVVVCSEVFLHSPDAEIVELINELSRIGKKVIVSTWYEKGNYVHSGHCWTRDYKKILKENNLHITHWEEDLWDNKQVGFVYTKLNA